MSVQELHLNFCIKRRKTDVNVFECNIYKTNIHVYYNETPMNTVYIHIYIYTEFIKKTIYSTMLAYLSRNAMLFYWKIPDH